MGTAWFGKREFWAEVTGRPYGEGRDDFTVDEDGMGRVIRAITRFLDGYVNTSDLGSYYSPAIGNILAAEEQANLVNLTAAVKRLLDLVTNE